MFFLDDSKKASEVFQGFRIVVSDILVQMELTVSMARGTGFGVKRSKPGVSKLWPKGQIEPTACFSKRVLLKHILSMAAFMPQWQACHDRDQRTHQS